MAKITHYFLGFILGASIFPICEPAFARESKELFQACSLLKIKAHKCVEHAELFEVEPEFTRACHSTFSQSEHQLSCFRSGANLDSLKFCQNLKWSPENSLTCMRSLQSKEVAKQCMRFSNTEDTQVTCLRLGREVPQIQACGDWSKEEEEKISCLRLDIPAAEIRNCKKNKQNFAAAKKCLLRYVSQRNSLEQSELQQAIAEAMQRKELEEKIFLEEEAHRKKRIPASIKYSH